MNKRYTSNVVSILENGDAIIELPEDLLNEMSWKEGDILNIKEENGVVILCKVTDGEQKTS